MNLTIFPDPTVLSIFCLIATDPRPPPLRSKIESAIRGVRTNKAAGPDGVQPELPKVNCKHVVSLHHETPQLSGNLVTSPQDSAKSL